MFGFGESERIAYGDFPFDGITFSVELSAITNHQKISLGFER